MPLAPSAVAPDFVAARLNLIESQLRPNKIRDEGVLEAMGSLPRERFVPSLKRGIAYIDRDLEVASGRFLLEPMVLARLLQEAALQPSDKVLDIAPATGYSSAVLGRLVKEVVALEPDAALRKTAQDHMTALGIANVTFQEGVFARGCPDQGPYDVIFSNGAVDAVPQNWFDQLKEGGRLLVVVREYAHAHAAHRGEARIYQKLRGQIAQRDLFEASTSLLTGMAAPVKFHL